jgi:hypothetical protein
MYATIVASHVMSLCEPVVLMIDNLYNEINFSGLSN